VKLSELIPLGEESLNTDLIGYFIRFPQAGPQVFFLGFKAFYRP
jgi:hypothetical protein